MDRQLIARGVRRCSTPQFLLWILPWAALFAFGLYCAGLCLVKGLNQTNMDNRFAFGLWIFVDLTIIALGAGAFFTGFLLYILKLKDLDAVINSAVVIGFVCYSGAVAALLVDVGQPLRAWFTFWYPNVHSMLTEVTFRPGASLRHDRHRSDDGIFSFFLRGGGPWGRNRGRPGRRGALRGRRNPDHCG